MRCGHACSSCPANIDDDDILGRLRRRRRRLYNLYTYSLKTSKPCASSSVCLCVCACACLAKHGRSLSRVEMNVICAHAGGLISRGLGHGDGMKTNTEKRVERVYFAKGMTN